MTGEEPLIDPELLERLACPLTRKPLALADPSQVEAFNRAVKEGTLRTREGKPVTEEMDGALLVQGENLAYPIRDKIPVLLVEEGFVPPS